MARRLTQDEFIKKATELHNGRYDYSKTVYVRSADKIEVLCPIHGSFMVTANNHVSKSNLCGCPACYGNKKITLTDFLLRAKVMHGGKYDYSRVIIDNSQENITVICPEHGEFEQTVTRHLSGRGCQVCGGTKRQKTSSLLSKAVRVHQGMYDYSKVPHNAKALDDVTIICPKHGEFTQKLKQHISRGYGCSQCGQKSKLEQEIADFLSLYTTVERRNRKIIAPREIDIWLPEYNMGIEFHGLYHHTVSRVGNLHRVKWEMAQAVGIRLVQIFEDEWVNKQELVKGRLLAFLGKSEKRDARKLILRKVNGVEGRDFLNLHHIQGAGAATKTQYGLYEGDALVAIATFCQSRSGAMVKDINSEDWEVLRYASIGRVRGGFSKLFAQFIADVNPKKVISYCDLRYGTGGLYAASGFTLDSITEPDYWWKPKNKRERISRYATQKMKMKSPLHPLHSYYSEDKSETQICSEAGWEKVYGVGSQKWIWEAK